MKKTGKYLLGFMAMVLSLTAVTAQEVVFYASVDKNPVALGDIFSVKFTLENARGNITPPAFADFDVVFGPSTSTSVEWINGRQSMSYTVSYTLRPRAEGKYTIRQATARVGDKSFTSEAITLEVVKGSSAPAQQQRPGAPGVAPQQPRPGVQTDNNLIVRTQLSKNKVYQGEGLVISFVLLSRMSNIDLGEIEFPSLDGFWTEDVKSGATSWENEFEYINGVPYRKAILRQQLLFPQRSGTVEIAPFKLTAKVNRSFIFAGTEVKVQSYAQKVEVMPLPAGAPAGFKGAVGEYAFTGTLGKTNLQANDAIDLSFALKGKGNLKLVKAPPVEFPTDFEVYDPELKDRISISAGGMSGSRNFNYLVIPRYPGKYDIPVVEFTHFNPVRQTYVTEKVGPFTIQVSGEDGMVPESDGAIARSRVEPVRRDIRYIATDDRMLKPRGTMFFRSPLYFLLTLGPLLLFAGAVVYFRKREALLGDVKAIRKRKAHSTARRRLQAAKAAMDKGESSTFYAEIFSAMYGFLSDKLGTEKAELTKPLIREKLKAAGVSEALVGDALYIIETCEMARFAPVTGESDSTFYNRTSECIEKLEGIFK